MKTHFILMIVAVFIATTGYEQANTTLSNLTSLTSINQSLLPNNNNGKDLGSAAKSWRIVYIDSSIYLKDVLFIQNKGVQNVFMGEGAGIANTSGKNNAAYGYHALYNNKANFSNSAFGSLALANNTASSNSAFGYNALGLNTTGNTNVAVGAFALHDNTTAENNTAIGYQASYSNTTGNRNTTLGYQASYSNTNGTSNTATGWQSLYYNNSNFNSAYGANSLTYNTSGQYNNGIGYAALFSNATGNNNTATGYKSLFTNYGGSDNTATGSLSLSNLVNGDENTAVGAEALYSTDISMGNTAVGYQALYSSVNVFYNTALGFKADVFNNPFNSTAIGAEALVTESNKVRIGNVNITSIGGQVGWSTFSDGRYKKNIKQDVQGLAFINNLQPITYTVDINGLNEFYDKGRKKDSAYEKMKVAMKESSNKAATIIYNGFIAQDVEKAAAKLNYTFSGVDKPQSKDGLYGLRYADFVVPLVKAVQELDVKTKEIDELRNEVNELKQMVQSLVQTKSINANDSYLSQNIPNPSNGNTVIPFQIAKGSHSASIQIAQTTSGKIIKTIFVDVSATQVSINTNSFAAGSYTYSLIVNGKIAGSKKMILNGK